MNTRPISPAGPRSRFLFTPLFVLAGLALLLAAPTASADIGYQFVTVGNQGNANDPATGSLYGGVSYVYDIGTYDVTLNQYVAFLNAVAATDTYGLYNTQLGTDIHTKGITQNGTSGSYTYTVIGDGNRPVTIVTWFDAARMANWMQNGQPTGLGEVAGSTETGAYTLNGDITVGLETRNANVSYWIPSENEWYKAAYYDPTLNGGNGGYWTYATRSNTAPGNNANTPTLANEANYNNGVYSVSQGSTLLNGNVLTDVGEFTNSASAYGTYDQNGDVINFNDTVIGSQRGQRGGSWNTDGPGALASSGRTAVTPTVAASGTGFRLASVPEPSVAVSLIIAGGLLLSRRKRPSAL